MMGICVSEHPFYLFLRRFSPEKEYERIFSLCKFFNDLIRELLPASSIMGLGL
jgi:hypothetical protein